MSRHPPPMPAEDYEAIEAAVLDTARGRWFLAEYARRNRTADTQLLLNAIERIEALIAARAIAQPAPPLALAPPPPEPIIEAAPAEARVEAVAPNIAWDATTEAAAWTEAEPAFASEQPLLITHSGDLDQNAVDTELFIELDDVDWVPAGEPVRQEEENDLSPATDFEQIVVEALHPLAETVPFALAASAPPSPVEPNIPGPPTGTSPPLVDPADLDILSFEQKSVYFA